MGRKLLITGSILNFVIGALHIIALFFFLEWALDNTGANELFAKFPFTMPGSPYTETAAVSIAFILMGFYGLSAAGIIKKLPLLQLGIILITIIYLFRGITGLGYEFFAGGLPNGIIFSAIALFVGICYLCGWWWRWHGKGEKNL